MKIQGQINSLARRVRRLEEKVGISDEDIMDDIKWQEIKKLAKDVMILGDEQVPHLLKMILDD